MTEEYIEIIKYIQSLFPKPVYLVGGACRDILLEIEPKDYDFCSAMTTEEVKECLKGKHRAYCVGEKFGTIGFKAMGKDIEITQFRSEKYNAGCRKPEVEFVNSLNEDLSRRDFTINAICMRIQKDKIRIIDPFCGMEDLEHNVIRCVGSPKQRFKEDPLRMLRAIRFASRFNWKIEAKTYDKIKSGAIQILDISRERWMMELDKILLSDNVGIGLQMLWDTKLFNYMIPELSLQFNYDQNSEYHKFKLHEHTIKVVEACPKDINFCWAGLLHDIAKPFVRTEKFILNPGIVGAKITKNTVVGFDSINHFAFRGESKTNYVGHEILGAEMVKRIALHLKWSNERTKAVVELVANHLNEDCLLRQYDNLGKN